MAPSNKRSVRSALAVLDIEDIAVFEEVAGDREQEFKIVKKAHFNKALVLHPDKGGDPEKFREMRESFELLRDLYDKKTIDCFSECMGGSSSNAENVEYDMGGVDFGFQSWEYYQEAGDTPVPIYHMEPARSGRSKCTKCKAKKMRDEVTGKRVPVIPTEEQFIDQGAVRIGSINNESGSYGRWCHLKCWRIPMRIWLGLPDPSNCQDAKAFDAALCSMSEVLLSGFSQLDDHDRAAVVQHAMDRSNWARPTKRFPAYPLHAAQPATSKTSASQKSSESRSNHQGALQKQSFLVPKPGHGMCAVGTLQGNRFCLTGIFPELGGGVGLKLGKDRAKVLIESFGGRVTSCVSGKTDVLVVGKEPGSSKVSKARGLGTQLMSLRQLQQGLLSGAENLETFPDDRMPLVLGPLSTGYRNNGLGQITGPENTHVPKAKKSTSKQPPAAAPPAKAKTAPAAMPEITELLDDSSDEKEEAIKASHTIVAVSKGKKHKDSTSIVAAVQRPPSSLANAPCPGPSTVVEGGAKSTPRQKISIPCPGQEGCAVGVFVGDRFAISGAFPELGGGRGSTLGHAQAISLIEAFGGKVTSCVSGKTSVLLVGNNAGLSKLAQARGKGTQLMWLSQLLHGLRFGASRLGDFPQDEENVSIVGQTKRKGKRPLATIEGAPTTRLTRSRLK